MSNPLVIRREQNADKGAVVLQLEGRLDMGALESFKTLFTEEFSSGNHKLVLNFSGVNFIVSTHLGVIMSSYKTAQSKGGDIKFTNLTEEVYGIFDLLQLTSILSIHKTEEEALAEF
ncbi:MAG: STAS domain-containing protein [Candidatus Cloacimonetes bacterium]|nr:STAS domain-containing protein [Candidatus Cloacimonadota bacterium]